MAAPSGIVWGSTYGSGSVQGRLGIYTKITNTSTQTTVNVQVWFWTKYGIEDNNNTLYYDIGPNVTSATTSLGTKSLYHEVSTGSGWSTSNQTKIIDNTYTYTRGTSASTYKIYVKFDKLEYGGGTVYTNGSFTVPKLDSYTVSYNANGGTGAPSSQTKYYGKTLYLSSSKPTRTGYDFLGWATTSAGSAAYQPGAAYTANASATLYAVWRANTYTVTYNANGGSGAPNSQTKTHGVTLKLSNDIPSREFHNFLGWAISSATTEVSYAAGADYTGNASITLYAVWELAYIKPRIRNATVSRCTETGVITDEGTYAALTFDWECDYDVESIVFTISEAGTSVGTPTVISATGTSGSFSQIVGDGNLDTETAYSLEIVVVDTIDDSSITLDIPSQRFPIDVLVGGTGVAVGTSATLENTLEVAYTLKPTGNRYSSWSRGVANQAGYVKMAHITIIGTNANWPITFVFTSRKMLSPMTVHVTFDSASTNDPELNEIRYEGSNYGAFLVKHSESKWDLYVTKSSASDTITLQDWWMSSAMETRATVDFPGTLDSQLPNPYYRATPLIPRNILDSFFPVGYVLILYSHADPNTMYPGTTWERITNSFLWATDENGDIGITGGEKTHTLTAAEMPRHSHGNVVAHEASGTTSLLRQAIIYRNQGVNTNWQGLITTEETGSGAAHNNMPPYIQVSVWRRTS